jgi:hypothetical protein
MIPYYFVYQAQPATLPIPLAFETLMEDLIRQN